MKVYTKLVMGIIIPILAACQGAEKQPETNHFTRNDFKKTVILSNPQEILLEGDTILADPASYYLLRDSFIIVQNQYTSNSFLDLYSLGSNRLVAHLAPKGRGPGEFITCNASIQSNEANTFYLKDNVNLYTIDVASTIKNKKLYISDSYQYSNENLHPNIGICRIDTSSYIGYNLWYINHFEYNTNKMPEISIYKTVNHSPSGEKNKYFPGSVNGASLFMNPDKKQIWLADWHSDIIKIYDNSLNLVKTLIGPDHYNVEYSTIETPALTMVTFANNKNYRTYSSFTYTKDYVYIIYEGINATDVKEFEQGELPPSEIFKFNWKGDLICHYKLDKYIYTVSVSSDEKYFYCTSRNTFSGEIHLLKYKNI